MTLSPKVDRPPIKTSSNGRNLGRRSSDPFGGMNQSSTDIQYAPRAPPVAERKRLTSRRERTQREREPFHALKMQKALSVVSYDQRNFTKNTIQERDTFGAFTFLPEIQDSIATQALSGLDELAPTPIQRLAIPMLLENGSKKIRSRTANLATKEAEQFLLAAETGSGKTLAYLLPVLDSIKRAEMSENGRQQREEPQELELSKLNSDSIPYPPRDAPHPTTGRPRAVILLPTSELVTQVGTVVKLLSHKVKFRSAMISAAYTPRVIRNRLFSPNGIDVVISTPHLLASISGSDPNILSRVTHLVIDEADSLLDRSFAPSTSAIVDKSTPSLKQLILCSATIPRSLDSYLQQRFPDMQRLVTPRLHAIPRRVQLGVVDVEKQPYNGNKMLACADTIWSIGKATHGSSSMETSGFGLTRLLVFVNERETSQKVADYLASKGIDAVTLHRDTPEQRQSQTIAQFTSNGGHESSPTILEDLTKADVERDTPPLSVAKTSFGSRNPRPTRHLANTKVLVSTDLGSRGIDTLAVRHVVLYDVPHSTVDFIHRLGRTGRMGRRGRGIVLVGKHDRKDVVREVRESMYKGQALI